MVYSMLFYFLLVVLSWWMDEISCCITLWNWEPYYILNKKTQCSRFWDSVSHFLNPMKWPTYDNSNPLIPHAFHELVCPKFTSIRVHTLLDWSHVKSCILMWPIQGWFFFRLKWIFYDAYIHGCVMNSDPNIRVLKKWSMFQLPTFKMVVRYMSITGAEGRVWKVSFGSAMGPNWARSNDCGHLFRGLRV